jgi:putative effector of murein hydrolase
MPISKLFKVGNVSKFSVSILLCNMLTSLLNDIFIELKNIITILSNMQFKYANYMSKSQAVNMFALVYLFWDACW